MWETESTKRVTQFLPKCSASCLTAKLLLRISLLSSTAYACITKKDTWKLAMVPALGLSLPAVRASSRALRPAPPGTSTGEQKINKHTNTQTSPNRQAKCCLLPCQLQFISFPHILAC